MNKVKITECPRDAMQGLPDFIPTASKINYINHLLQVGFETIDFGSFVSPKAIPQLSDSAQVVEGLDMRTTKTTISAIVANDKGATIASSYDVISFLGYPLSVSATFQQRNINASIEESLKRLESIASICEKTNKELIVYISMGFGNPYGDPRSPEIITQWAKKLHSEYNVTYLTISDTIGCSTPNTITSLFETLLSDLPQVEFGVHFHSTPTTVEEKIQAAYHAGCRKFDVALQGFGGCPLAKDELIGNIPTETIIAWFDKHKIETGVNKEALDKGLHLVAEMFPGKLKPQKGVT